MPLARMRTVSSRDPVSGCSTSTAKGRTAPRAADRDVTAAVDQEAPVAAKAVGDRVRAQALAGSAGIEGDAERPGDRASLGIDLDKRRQCDTGGGLRGLAERCLGERWASAAGIGRPSR